MKHAYQILVRFSRIFLIAYQLKKYLMDDNLIFRTTIFYALKADVLP